MEAQNSQIPTVSSMASLLLMDWPYGVDQNFYFIIIFNHTHVSTPISVANSSLRRTHTD